MHSWQGYARCLPESETGNELLIAWLQDVGISYNTASASAGAPTIHASKHRSTAVSTQPRSDSPASAHIPGAFAPALPEAS